MLLERTMDEAMIGREGPGPIGRAVRIALVVYLSPVIVIVMAIGVVGMLATRVGKMVTRLAFADIPSRHTLAGPMGFIKRKRSAGRRMATTTTRSAGEGRSRSR
jgi:hypothetical protein